METKITLEFYPAKGEGIVKVNDKNFKIEDVDFQRFILLAKNVVEKEIFRIV